jgi:hypothetical protein
MFSALRASLSRRFGGRRVDALVAAHRRGSVEAAVGWWARCLRDRDGVDQATVAPFARFLSADLVARLGTTRRVCLAVGRQPQGVLRVAALEAGVNLDAFPPGTTMTVADATVEVSRAAREPYQLLHAA